MHTLTETAPADVPVQSGDDDLIHLYRGKEFPVALCGYICHKFATWNDAARDRSNAGKDRCPECLRVARDMGLTIC